MIWPKNASRQPLKRFLFLSAASPEPSSVWMSCGRREQQRRRVGARQEATDGRGVRWEAGGGRGGRSTARGGDLRFGVLGAVADEHLDLTVAQLVELRPGQWWCRNRHELEEVADCFHGLLTHVLLLGGSTRCLRLELLPRYGPFRTSMGARLVDYGPHCEVQGYPAASAGTWIGSRTLFGCWRRALV